MLGEFKRLYETAHPGVDVQILDMGSQDAYDRIRTERENPQADVWWGAPSAMFVRAEAESLLARYVPSWDSTVGPALKSGAGVWYATFLTPEVIMYNNHVLRPDQAPQDWDDLLAPAWRDKILLRYPLASGTMRTIFCALIADRNARAGTTDAGFRWLLRLDANTRGYAADPTQLYLRIAREEALVSLWNLPDVIIQTTTNHYPFGYVIPRSGTPMIADCIGIVRGAPHPEEAIRFYEFVTSRTSLIRQAASFYRIPARRDIGDDELPAWLTGLNIREMKVDWDVIGRHEQAWMKRWDDDIKGKGTSSQHQ